MQDTERPAGDTTGDRTGDEAIKREAPVTAGPAAPRTWSDEEKVLIAQESFEPDMSVVEVAERHGVPVRQLSLWRKLMRKGKLLVPPNPPASETESPFAAVAVEAAQGPAHVGSVSIETRGVTVRLDGDV
ncbi:MAG: transposase, partial [Gammaproteobacteria bacterium]|nr:transposase [Gammaproteobacteria bacterium]